jgi:hypothetical protein
LPSLVKCYFSTTFPQGLSVPQGLSRRFPEKLRDPEYDHGIDVRTVRDGGEIGFKRNYYFISELLAGEKVGLTEAADGKYEIRFGFCPIGILDITLGKVEPKSTNVLPMSIG